MNNSNNCMFLCGRFPSNNNKVRDQFIPSIPKSNIIITEAEAQKIRANDLLQLTDIERERIYHDIQGITTTTSSSMFTLIGGDGDSGCSNSHSETSPGFVQKCMKVLEYELIQLSKNTAYEQALLQQMADDSESSSEESLLEESSNSTSNNDNNSGDNNKTTSYVTSYKFRLMFLRAELFEAKKAARRIISFLEEKLSLFGPAR